MQEKAERLSTYVVAARREVWREPQYPPSMRPEIRESAVWRAFYTALLTDSEKTWE
jgi:hypothetical protein